jgi:hypothetical protein
LIAIESSTTDREPHAQAQCFSHKLGPSELAWYHTDGMASYLAANL